ncbi:hypothetical protein HUG10_15705 [Halorarum halophilum]|uniref:Right handed beta helix region n=1 Tax=Halorarum halophilum TaxID=2743090 RepID=A0A7D5KXX3_9EURY|nr:hypothetical protein [Halobaculum halophilum]QLG28898.1 hypothetical protein HUG10_15705 [Halobaculum halophilum]
MPDANSTRARYEYDPPIRLDDLDDVGAGSSYDPSTVTTDEGTRGGGWPTAGTKPTESDADVTPENREQLVEALETAEKGDVIFVPGRATIDLTGVHDQGVAAPNVTLASDRGTGSEGAELVVRDSMYMRDEEIRRVFNVTEPGFRLTGLRLVGPQSTHNEWVSYEENRPMSGIEVNADRVEIDNVVGRGWGHTPINIGRAGFVERAHVHHCDLVDNPQDALGYGVSMRHAEPLIQRCYFDNNRHSIAGSGHEDCSFIACHNLFGPHGVLHAIDMHCRNSDDGTSKQGGRRVSVHHNEMLFTTDRISGRPQEAIKLRGVPTEGARIVDNRFHHPSDRFDTTGPGRDGDAVLLEVPEGDAPSFEAAGIEVRDNVSDDDPNDALGPLGGRS